jgi:tetratricopeptide (TPR) repeat protein
MTPSPAFARVRELVERAHALDPDARRLLLDLECAGDGELRREVEALLRAAARSHGFLERPPAVAPASSGGAERAEPGAGARIGPWVLSRPIGSGGMGTVFLASRADGEFEQRVAVKLIRSEHDTRDVLRRFRTERQLLASLDHPGIARLLDGGSTDDRRPYLVMEYVEGEPIDRFCQRRELGVRERVELFAKVCDAVAHAHKCLVVHRDLKPGNVLVTEEGEPKLIDFGIAKLLAPDPASGSQSTLDLTGAGLRRLTPGYASPEQVRGDPVTTASDVYSLGVLLYELLAGARPYRIESTEPTAILRVVCESEPPPPSGAARDEERARLLRGDLDAIAMKALRKEPDRRYRTVDQLAEDLRRHLGGRPVLARPDTVRYRTGKFVRRHRWSVLAASAALVALVAGLAASLSLYLRSERERVRAERRFEDVRELATGLLFDVHDKIRDLSGSTEAREFIASTALERLDRLAAEDSEADPGLRHDLARGYVRLGDVLGRLGSGSLGRTDEAARSYRKASALLATLRPGEIDEFDRHLQRAVVHSRLGDVAEAESRSEDAVAEFEKALSERELAAGIREVHPDRDPKLSRLHGRLFDLLSALGRLSEADEHLRETTRIVARDADLNADARKAQGSLGVQWNKLGEAQAKAGDLESSALSHRCALSIFEGLCARHPEDATSRRHRAIALGFLGRRLDELSRPEEALPVLERAASESASLAAADPGNARVREDLAVTLNSLGDAQAHLGCPEEALRFFRRSLEIRRRVAELSPRDAWTRRSLTISLELTAAALRELERLTEAGELQLESWRVARSLVDDDPKDARALRREALSCIGLAVLEGRRAESAELSPEERGTHWRAARDWDAAGLEILEGLRRRGALQPADEDLLLEARAHLQDRCEPALAALGL